MNILFFLNSKSKGGLEIYALKTAEKLKEKNLNIRFFLNKKSELKPQKVERIGLFQLLSTNFDIVHFFRSQDLIFSRILKAKKYFFTNMMGLSISKKDIYHRFLYRKIDKIFAISEAVKRELINNLPVNKEKVVLLYPGIDTNFFKKDLNLRKKFRDKYKIKEEEIIISMTSRFDPKKGQKEAIEVFKILKEKHKNIKLFLKGAIEDINYFNEIKNKKINDVYFLDFSEDLREFLSASDIFLFPSYGEALGFSLIEAMSMELPCIAFSERAVPEIIDDEIDGFLVKKKDLKEFALKLELLIINSSLRKKLGKKAREKAIKKFNIERYIQELLNYYYL